MSLNSNINMSSNNNDDSEMGTNHNLSNTTNKNEKKKGKSKRSTIRKRMKDQKHNGRYKNISNGWNNRTRMNKSKTLERTEADKF